MTCFENIKIKIKSLDKEKNYAVSLTEVATDDEGLSMAIYESNAKFINLFRLQKQRQ